MNNMDRDLREALLDLARSYERYDSVIAPELSPGFRVAAAAIRKLLARFKP
jgi:hypothetical protein